MEILKKAMEELISFNELKEQLNNRGISLVSGCIDSQKTQLAYSIGDGFKYKVIACSSEQKAAQFLEEYGLYADDGIYYPARDFLFFEGDIKGNSLTQARINTVKKIIEGESAAIVTTIDGLMDKLIPIEEIAGNQIKITAEEEIDIPGLSRDLVRLGYDRVDQVEAPGQFAVRGAIIDIFSYAEEDPWRIELWGDEVDNIRSFDAVTQRSEGQMSDVTVFPNMDAGSSDAGDERVSFLEYFAKDETLIILDEPNHLQERGEFVETEYAQSVSHRLEKGYITSEQADIMYPMRRVWALIGSMKGAAMCTLDSRRDLLNYSMICHLETRAVGSYNSHFEMLVRDLQRYKKEKYRILLISGSRTRARRLAEELSGFELNAFYSEDRTRQIMPGEIMVTTGRLFHGYEYPQIRLLVISDSDIFGREKKKKRKHRTYEGEKINSFSDLKVGDYVVHESHGIGIYEGIEQIEMDHVIKDYMKIAYAKGGNLYIPAAGFDAIQKYAGNEARVKVNSLGGQEWTRTRTRVQSAVNEIASELVELYAVRQQDNGYAFGPDTVWQREFEELFEYEETDDQLRAIEETKKDMESSGIMDRLICGDVGYGKTEVAIRAAFKAVQESKQVAVLVPTTILAQQHYNTFIQRMKDFPVKIELMSRFRTPTQIKNTVKELKSGRVDIVIGTHRLLSQDVEFKDLGLLIVDEEQRFGVTHKEKIKQIRKNVDVLTLTATPIPRTLHMSLVGIRDMSVLEEPPVDRMAVQTYVMEYNEETVREAINRELARGGQVYYVHNRVDNISDIASFLQRLVPDAVVAYAHGQMDEKELEGIMYDFINGEVDVLVSTTIVETGLDIPNVNTIIINDADKMGLSQLYQLRGRVGRSNRTAYAFLMYRRNKMLKEVAEKRLKAIREFSELGSGFKIAMRDLEIRGAGNLLGARQSGHLEAVGYDLYCKMLNEAVKRLKGEIAPESDFTTEIDIPIDAYIPDSYIDNELRKLDTYKRIAGIASIKEREDMEDELTDRFGDMPSPVINLLKAAELKFRAHQLGIREISARDGVYTCKFYEKAPLDPSGIPAMLSASGGSLRFRADRSPVLVYEYKGGSKSTKGRNAAGKNSRSAGSTLPGRDAGSVEITEYILDMVGTLLREDL